MKPIKVGLLGIGTVGSGTLLVDVNLSGVSGAVDLRSNAEQILSQIDATILARTTGGA
jgi:hypothetical protein